MSGELRNNIEVCQHGNAARRPHAPWLKMYTVDAFTALPYRGNPCAVVFDADALSLEQMQAIAAEMNLSETAFIRRSETASIGVSFFTPRRELPFAGHPVIAVAHAMLEERRWKLDGASSEIDVEFPIGVLPITLENDGMGHRIVMTQRTPVFTGSTDPSQAAEALDISCDDLLPNWPLTVGSVGVRFLFIGLRDPVTLLSVVPDWGRLRAMCREADATAAYLIAPSRGGPGKLSARLLDPFVEHEDPFTGSACGVAALLAVRSGIVDGPDVVVEQGEAVGRIGYAEVDVGDGRQSLRVAGRAATVVTGRITIPHG